MAFCVNCGQPLSENVRFCPNCGTSIGEDYSQRKIEYVGKVHKCPECGEVLKSFEINCPVCGYELRSAKTSSAVKEFALKLEAIEARREYEKPRGLFAMIAARERISKTDEQKVSLIKSFPVPNSKEDMLEFMILATSSMNMSTYDSTNTSTSKGEGEINAAWFSKVQQVYEKAKRTYSSDGTFFEIKGLYDKCNTEIRNAKKKGILKWILMYGWLPVLLVAVIIWNSFDSSISEKKELSRLESIVAEIEIQLENGEYKYALMNANALRYDGTWKNEEQERQWIIKREYWIDKVIEKTAEKGIILERPENDVESKEPSDSAGGDVDNGFIKGFKDAIQPELDVAKENVDEFNSIMNDKKSWRIIQRLE